MSQRSYLKKPPAHVVAIAEPETEGSLQGVIDAAMRIAESRAKKQMRMREAILANDIETALSMACELAGFSQPDVAKRVARLLSSVVKTAS